MLLDYWASVCNNARFLMYSSLKLDNVTICFAKRKICLDSHFSGQLWGPSSLSIAVAVRGSGCFEATDLTRLDIIQVSRQNVLRIKNCRGKTVIVKMVASKKFSCPGGDLVSTKDHSQIHEEVSSHITQERK